MRTAFLTIVLAVLAAAPAQADIFAVAPVVAPGHNDIDIGLIDASTGGSLTLPAGVNTPANESHPTISNDGRRIAFERTDRAAGTDRLIAADLTTGQTMDLFNAFETQTLVPVSPAIAPDGNWVTTGSEGDGLHGRSLDAFPNSVSASTNDLIFPGTELLDPTQTVPNGSQPSAFRRNLAQPGGGKIGQVVMEDVPGAPGPVAANTTSFSVAHPSIAESGGHLTMVYDVAAVASNGQLGQRDIGFCVIFFHAGGPCGLGQGTLPPLVNSSLDETRPAFTPDGRYIGFVRDEANAHERLYVFDTETQTLIDSDGTDLGLVAARDTGSLSLYEKPVFRITSLPSFGTLMTSLTSVARVGLLVQRVVGHHELLGRRVPTLEPAGRIPLGAFTAGRHAIHWRPRGLKPGRYQFTPRALAKDGRIRDLGTPRIFRVR